METTTKSPWPPIHQTRRGWRTRVAYAGLWALLTMVASALPGAALALPEFAAMNWTGRPGFVYAAARDGVVIASGAYGLASVELDAPLHPDSVLNAGSIAKTITAWAILQLEADGLLTLEDEVHQHLPELPDYGAAVSLRQLLNHTGGLKDYWALSSLTGQHAADLRTQAQAVNLISRQPGLNFAPGTQHLYSNSGYILLAEILAGRTGESFAHWVQHHAFAPLGMERSRIQDDPLAVVAGYAPSYRTSAAGIPLRQDPLPSGVIGSGNLLTTAPDLLRWGQFLLTATVAGQPLLERMRELPALPGAQAAGYGLGISSGEYRSHPVAHHGGANAGYRSHLLLFPEQNLVIAVLGNGSALRPAQLAETIADRLLGLAEPDRAPEPETTMPTPFPAEYAGLYALDTGTLLKVRVLDDGPIALVMGVPYHLHAEADNAFRLDDGNDRLVFQPDPNGGPPQITLHAGGRATRGTRETPRPLPLRDARRYTGTFDSPALETRYRVTAVDDGLLLTLPNGIEVPLTRLREDLFLHWDLADFLIRFERDRNQRVQGFSVSVNRAYHIEFRRPRR